MNESSVSTPFMEKLAVALGPRAVVKKIADSSTIGMPDCYVQFRNAWWFEFKLWVPLRSWRRGDYVPIENFIEDSPVQYATMKQLAAAGAQVFYIVWVKKSKDIRLIPVTSSGFDLLNEYTFTTTTELVEYVAKRMKGGSIL